MGSVKSKPRQRRNSSFSPTKLPTRSNRKRSEIFESFLVGMCTSGLQQSNTSIGIINNFLPPVEEMANRNRTVDSTKKTLCSSLDEGNIFEARKNWPDDDYCQIQYQEELVAEDSVIITITKFGNYEISHLKIDYRAILVWASGERAPLTYFFFLMRLVFVLFQKK